MKELIQLKDEWRGKLDELDDNKYADIRQSKNLLIILALYELLMKEVNNKKKSKKDELQLISNILLTHINQLGNSVFQLITTGNSSSSIILSRAILESLIDFSYLWLCKDITGQPPLERRAWIDYSSVRKYSIHNKWIEFIRYRQKQGGSAEFDILDHWDREKIKKNVEKYDENYPNFKSGSNKRSWALDDTLDKRARKVDDTGKVKELLNMNFSLEEQYIVAYKKSSEFVHGASSIISGYIDESSQLTFGPNGLMTGLPFLMTNNYLIVFAAMFRRVNHLKVDITGQLSYWGYTNKTD
ncbi:DUF5677 domain-containing protein [Paenibacillus amylolyticus]|uniref:DUF5677 domain-containing protein n=1 Tax=Paenibacillus amylolyticus TaxID=1451 RepID=UPI000FD9F363|nr:DUF5677 domain-containing protein [Paenibacillus amylolyticus]